MTRAPAHLATGLILATAINITAIVSSRAGDRATVFIVYAVSAHNNSVQHISTAKYDGASLDEAMRKCEHDVPLILEGYRRQNFTVLMPPQCGIGKPWSWIEVP